VTKYVCFAALLVASLLVGCGGASGGQRVDPASAPREAAKPPAAAVQNVPLQALPKRVRLNLPSGGADALLGGTPNRPAAAEVTAALKGAGFDLRGVEVLVLPLTGLNQSLLVAEFDEAKGASLPADPTKLLVALAKAPAVKAANVTRVAFDVRGSDSKGPYLLTLSLPMTAVDGLMKSNGSAGSALPTSPAWSL